MVQDAARKVAYGVHILKTGTAGKERIFVLPLQPLQHGLEMDHKGLGHLQAAHGPSSL